MKIFPPIVEIGLEEGFEKNDLFGYSAFGSELGQLFRNAEDPLVVALDDNWGIGKTTFVKMWMGYVRRELDCYPIYFDAFEHDFVTDPFTAISAALSEVKLPNQDKKNPDFDKAMSDFKANAIRVGGIFIRGAAGLAVRSLTAGFVDAEAIKQVKLTPEQVVEAAASAADSVMESQIEAAKNNKALFEELRDSISNLRKSLPKNSGPLIIVVDELDRCKPSFAVELIEVLKHFFCVEGVHFLLSVNMNQLGESVRAIYGLRTGADAYLRKFIHLSRPLPEPEVGERRSIYIESLIDRMEIPYRLGDKNSISTKFILTHFLNRTGYTLRDIDRAVTNLAVVIASRGGPDDFRTPSLTATLAIIAAINPPFFEKCRNAAYSIEGVSSAGNDSHFDHLLLSGNEREKQLGEIYKYVVGPDWKTGSPRDYLDGVNSDLDALLAEWSFALAPSPADTPDGRHLQGWYWKHARRSGLQPTKLLQSALNEIGRLGEPAEDKV